MALRRPSRALVLLAAAATARLAAADFEPAAEARDWYLSLGITIAPTVSEETRGPNGSSKYDWKDQKDDIAPRLAVGHLHGAGGSEGGWTYGGEVVLTTCDITPARYEVGGLAFENTSSRSLRYSTAGVTLFAGYEFGLNTDPEELSSFFILGPFIGGGAAYADSEVRDQNQAYAHDSGFGWYLEGGLRGGFFLTEHKWLGGVVVDLTYGTSQVDVDFGSGVKSTLTLDRVGVGAALVIGYRL